MSRNIIEIENLNKSFDKNSQILKNLSLKIKEQECIILKGVSGSGKTTLLNLIAGLDKPDSGKILIENKPIIKMPDIHLSHFRNQTIGMIFQSFNLIEHLDVLQNVMVPLIATKLSRKEQISMAKKALKIANIEHKSNLLSSKLSGGEKQRCAIARAIANNPKIILCDEPTANLDKKNALLFIDTINKLNKLGKTILIATHDPIFDNLEFTTRVIQMKNGEIV